MQEEAFEFAAFVGIDWADRKHDVCLQVTAFLLESALSGARWNET
jgi:hypothetical protein